MDPIREAHLSEPGLLVIDVAGRDDATVFALQGRDRPPVGLLDRRAPPGTSASPVFGCGRSAAGPRGGLPAGAGADGHVERRGPPSRGGGGPARIHGATPVPGVPGRRRKSP
ncbi:DUF6207 family protein [Streptomyces albogriseolus]